MERKLFCSLFFTAVVGTGCVADSSETQKESLITMQSVSSVEATANKLNAILQKKGLTVFARINHAGNAAKANLELRPTELIIFGNPKVGTPVMKCAQTSAIDLPQKMLIWQDKQDKVWLSYNNPDYLKQRHNIEGCDNVLGKITGVLDALGKAATSQ